MADTGLLKPTEAAKWLTVHRSTLYRLPVPYVMIGKRRAYRVEDLETFASLNLNRPPLRKAS
jgi:hypothetical protein